VRETADWTRRKIIRIRDLIDETAQLVREKAPKIYSRELVDVVYVVDAGIAKRETASEYLKRLAEIRVLREVAVGRDKLFLNPALLALLKE
ncbi:MAG: Fic family protein, partial [Candidatus Krumholzibacteria bacterium]|nr:Fic family protein [Candidatus Krumholzibacteria bacterium]